MNKHFFCLLMVFLPIYANAEDVNIDGIYYSLNTETNSAEVRSSPNQYRGDIAIPASITHEGVSYVVTSIGSHAFSYCKITSVDIPNSIISIEDWAFEGCSGLTSLTIPSNVSYFGNNAFANCYGLSSITILSTITTSSFFDNCPNIKEVSFDCDRVTAIFHGRQSLEKVVMSNKVNTIDNHSFSECISLTSIIIPQSISSVGISAFYNTAWYNSQPNGPVYIGQVFYRYKSTMQDNTSIEIKEGTKSIAAGAFMDCSGIESVYIPNSVTSIGFSTFSNCTSLKSINIPSGITNIESGTFSNCRNLKFVIIPESVMSIEDNAFIGCSELTSVDLPNGITYIGMGAFESCSSIETITIPNSVNMINESTFRDCINLKSIEISKNATYIGDIAFKGCCNLKSIIIPNSVMNIGNNVFEGCISLTSVALSESMTNIGVCAFSGCSALNTITLHNNLKTIDYGAFVGCSSLTTVIIPNSVNSVEDWAFSGCLGLKYIIIGENVESVGHCAFSGIYGLDFKDVFCYSKEIPIATDYTFTTVIENTTLHVPASSLEAYKNTTPWSRFGKIVTLTNDDPKPSNINQINTENIITIESYYIDGKRISKLQRGLNILRMSDGTTKKVMIK